MLDAGSQQKRGWGSKAAGHMPRRGHNKFLCFLLFFKFIFYRFCDDSVKKYIHLYKNWSRRMHAFSQVNRTGIARSTEPVGTQCQSRNSPPLRVQIRTPIRSTKLTKTHPKPLQNRAKIGFKSLPRASQEPSGARVSPKSARKRSKRGPERPQGRPWGPTRASPERPRPPKERPEGLRGLARGTSREAKSTPSPPQK